MHFAIFASFFLTANANSYLSSVRQFLGHILHVFGVPVQLFSRLSSVTMVHCYYLPDSLNLTEYK